MRFLSVVVFFATVTSAFAGDPLTDFFSRLNPNTVTREISREYQKALPYRHVKHRGGGTVLATWYGHEVLGKGRSGKTANGERFNPNGMTTAHKSLPFGTRVHVTNPKTGRSVIVRVNDRGPHRRGYSYDLAHGAARSIGFSSGPIIANVLN